MVSNVAAVAVEATRDEEVGRVFTLKPGDSVAIGNDRRRFTIRKIERGKVELRLVAPEKSYKVK